MPNINDPGALTFGSDAAPPKYEDNIKEGIAAAARSDSISANITEHPAADQIASGEWVEEIDESHPDVQARRARAEAAGAELLAQSIAKDERLAELEAREARAEALAELADTDDPVESAAWWSRLDDEGKTLAQINDPDLDAEALDATVDALESQRSVIAEAWAQQAATENLAADQQDRFGAIMERYGWDADEAAEMARMAYAATAAAGGDLSALSGDEYEQAFIGAIATVYEAERASEVDAIKRSILEADGGSVWQGLSVDGKPVADQAVLRPSFEAARVEQAMARVVDAGESIKAGIRAAVDASDISGGLSVGSEVPADIAAKSRSLFGE